jgi:flagellar basal body rod protein FlgG
VFSTINSGLSTSSQALSVTANNLANVNTVGFKESRINFADVFANDPTANQKTAVGVGAQTTSVERVMSQGAITSTGRVTDLAITGQGFFVLGSADRELNPIPHANIPAFNGTNLQAGNWEPPVPDPINPITSFNGENLPTGSYTSPDLPDLQVRIKYNIEFENGDFTDTTASTNGTITSIPGWEIYKNQISLGQGSSLGISSIAGFPTPIDNSLPTLNGQTLFANDDDTIQNDISFNSEVANGTVRLYSSGTSVNGNDIIHGPYLVSKDPVYIASGANVDFDWKAQNGGDWYDVYGYLLNVDNGKTVELLNSTGDVTDWINKPTQIPESGNYKFVFVSGTYDESGGRWTGASLYIDNISITGNSPPINSDDTYSVSVDGLGIDAGGPVAEKTDDLSSYIDENGNTVSVEFSNPSGPWGWSYEILKDGAIVQSGTWNRTETGIKLAQYTLPAIEPTSVDTASTSTNWSFDNISGECSNVFMCGSGSGTNAHNGFSGKDNYISFGNGGNAGQRYLSLNDLDLQKRASVSFDVIRGNNANGGQSPDSGEDLLLEYSIDGTNYVPFSTIEYNDLSLDDWSRKTVSLPSEAQTASTSIRFRQPASSGPEFDHWGLSDIVFDPIIIPPPPEPASSDSTDGESYSWTAGEINGSAKGVFLNSEGTGSTDNDGFSGRSSYISFGLGGDTGERFLTVDNLDTRLKEYLKFDIIKGTDANGGQSPNAQEGLKLLYSTDGQNFIELASFDENSIVYDNWTSIKIALPVGARTENTTFKFLQSQTSGPGYDHWGLYNVEFTDFPKKPVDNSLYYTRAGNFQVDKEGYITNAQGLRLLGKDLLNSQDLAPVRIPLSEDRLVDGIAIDPKGFVSVSFSDGTVETNFQVSLANFSNDSGLKPVGNTMFKESIYSGKPRYGDAGTNGMGNLMSGSLEQSNTDITAELMLMMKAQQAFSGNSRMLQTYVDMASRLTDKI